VWLCERDLNLRLGHIDEESHNQTNTTVQWVRVISHQISNHVSNRSHDITWLESSSVYTKKGNCLGKKVENSIHSCHTKYAHDSHAHVACRGLRHLGHIKLQGAALRVYVIGWVKKSYTSTQLNCNTALETFSLLIASHVPGQSLPKLAGGISTLCSTIVQSLLLIKLMVQSVDFNHLLQHYDWENAKSIKLSFAALLIFCREIELYDAVLCITEHN
jgi:hypothetical protein